MEEIYEVRIEGTAPILMNKFIGDESQKTKRSGKSYNHEKEAKQSLYTDKDGILIQPAIHIESSMIKAAVNFPIPGRGKKTFKDAFKAGVFVSPESIPHENQEWEMYVSPVVINRSRVMKARGMIKKWALEFQIKVIDERISKQILKDILNEAGKYYGIGDWRPRFGRFEVKKFEFKKAS
jgi:hypothetical protein